MSTRRNKRLRNRAAKFADGASEDK